jgi:DnaJ-class molecular chaperone
MTSTRDDHYAALGLTPPVGVAEIRRAYRLLALRHHPDRAGPEATATFQRIAEAYRVLSDPWLRSSYDAEQPAVTTRPGAGEPIAKPASPRTTEHLIVRLSGTLEALAARRIARPLPGGLIELHATADEARAGGIAAIRMPMTVPCPTCGGIAAPTGVWCRRCQFAGSVVEEITLCVPIPPAAPDGMTFNLQLDRIADVPPMAVRLRVY